MDFNQKKIYIGIASYRDPYLMETLKELYNQALYPERIVTYCFGQYLPEDKDYMPSLDKIAFKKKEIAYANISLDIQEAGHIFSIYQSRNRAFARLNTSYDYALQIDAHNQFHAGWDVLLISIYESIKDSNALMSVKLPFWLIQNYENKLFNGPFENIDTVVDWRSPQTQKAYLEHQQWTAFTFLSDKSGSDLNLHEAGWYVFGGFIFGKPDFFLLKRPTWVCINGDEFLDSIRAFTGGWNVYTSVYVPIFHLYTGGYKKFTGIERPFLSTDFPNETAKHDKDNFHRIRDMVLTGAVDNETILNKRSMQDLYDYLGYSLKDIILEWEKEKDE